MRRVLHREKSYSFTATPSYDVIVVGAGPYGLSTGAHLRERGLRVAFFSKPLGFWQKNMPSGMVLRQEEYRPCNMAAERLAPHRSRSD